MVVSVRVPTRLLLLSLLVICAVAGAPAQAAPARPAAPRCDPIDPARCLLPWPNDFFTRSDRHAPTGRRLALRTSETPRNVHGVHVAAGPYDASDGFSPGQTIVVRIPGFDTPAALRASGAVPQTDLAKAFARRAPIVVIDGRTLRRHLIWAEIDSLASTRAQTTVLIHPAVNWQEGHRYIVALRDLRDGSGRRIAPSAAFRAYRDDHITRSRSFERRRAHMNALFRALRRAGIARHSLNLAWDFTVASESSLSRRLLSIRNRAFAGLGDRNLKDLRVAGRSPRFVVDKVQPFAPADEPNVARRVFGHVVVPCYLNRRGCPSGSRFRLDSHGLPARIPGNTYAARFECDVPRSATAQHPARVSLYGHGLFGDASEVEASNVEQLSQDHDVVVCGADLIGMADEDVPNAVRVLQDLSSFPTLPDRLQQGLLDFMFVGRAMIHPRGFATNPAFQDGGRSLLDTRHLYYYGNSQGGIAGGALTAVEPDLTRSVLYVGAMDYSVLLTRSVDWDTYSKIMYPSYPDQIDRQILLSMIQVLWDRGEPDGYAWHMTSHPLPDTPAHRVLQLLAFGDHQVANVQTEVEARTIGSRLRAPAVDPGRHSDVDPYYRIPRIGHFPFSGPAALEVWDIGPLRPAGTCPPDDSRLCGTPTPPAANRAPSIGVDPHDLVINQEARVRSQISDWLEPNGKLHNVCGREPCHAAGWTGP